MRMGLVVACVDVCGCVRVSVCCSLFAFIKTALAMEVSLVVLILKREGRPTQSQLDPHCSWRFNPTPFACSTQAFAQFAIDGKLTRRQATEAMQWVREEVLQLQKARASVGGVGVVSV